MNAPANPLQALPVPSDRDDEAQPGDPAESEKRRMKQELADLHSRKGEHHAG
jgi:hypothetical protein